MGVRLTVQSMLDASEATIDLDQPRIVIGRTPSADVPLPHPSVSGVHASLRQQGTGFVVTDERSTNGVFVGDVRLVPERARGVRSGDVLVIGPFRVRVDLGRPVASAASAEDRTAFARRLTGVVGDHALVVRNGSRAGERLELPSEGSWLVGRGEECALGLDDAEVSRVHAELVFDRSAARIADRDSKQGTFVGGRKVRDRLLRDGDVVLLGATELVYEARADRVVDAAARAPEDTPVPPLPEPPPPADERDEAPLAPLETLDEGQAEPPLPRPPRAARSTEDVADRFVFALAALVLVASLLAAAYLFRD